MKNLYANQYLQEASLIIEQLDIASIETITELLVKLRQRGGRLFLVGVGVVLDMRAMLSTTLESLPTSKLIRQLIT